MLELIYGTPTFVIFCELKNTLNCKVAAKDFKAANGICKNEAFVIEVPNPGFTWGSAPASDNFYWKDYSSSDAFVDVLDVRTLWDPI